jgi:DNA-binding CsgD family transcriptional regulator/PAS domain-containing protein
MAYDGSSRSGRRMPLWQQDHRVELQTRGPVRGDSAIELPDVVGSVYDSVVDASLWPSTLETVCHKFDGCLATLAVVDTVSHAPRFSAAYGDPDVVEPLINEYGANVPFYSALPRMEIDVPFTVDSIYALEGPGTRQAWIDSRIAREWVVPNALDDFFWLVLMRQPTRVGSLMIVTDKERRQISRRDLREAAKLSPHVRRAVTIGDLFDTERREAEIFRTIVESLAVPVIIVTSAMSILFANPAAEALLADDVVVASNRGQLAFRYAPAGAAVTRAVELGSRDEFALGPAGINVPLLKVTAPAVAHVMPLSRRDSGARMSGRAAAAIFIAAAGTSPIPMLDAFSALFGLTAAEKRVAGNVAQGLTRAEIALGAGVSDGTVKSQLAAIYDKTGTSDQRELALLIRELSPPVNLS